MSHQRFTARGARRPDNGSNARQWVDKIVRAHKPDRVALNYWRLVDAIRSKTDLLSPRKFRNAESDCRRVALACQRLACTASKWIRLPEFWGGSDSASRHRQWCDFVDHLLHAYDVPQFFAPIWFNEDLPKWHQSLHFHMGAGRSIRRFEYLPAGRASKSVAKWFLQAPVDASIDAAFRWAQVRTIGGDARLARLLMDRYAISDDEAWENSFLSVVKFLVKNQPLCKEEVIRIAQFAYEQRFLPASESVGPWMGDEPVDKGFDLQGWTLRRLRRHMVSWRDSLPKRRKEDGWVAAPYQPFAKFARGKLWQIIELRSPQELHKEGRVMRHCIATYARMCRNQTSSVWSLRYQLPDDDCRSVMTIDIDPRSHEIRQVQGKANSKPKRFFLQILDEWAAREGLKRA